MSDRKAVPSLPPTAAIADPQVRVFLEALSNAWAVRNGAGRDEEQFIRKGDLRAAASEAVLDALSGAAALSTGGQGATDPGNVYAQVLRATTKIVTSSEIYELLRAPTPQIEMPNSALNELRDRINREAEERIAAIEDEAAARGSGINSEKISRETADGALQSQINTIIAAGTSDTATILAALQDEQDARIAADGAEAISRSTLAAQMRGSYEGTDSALLTQGLLYSERQARVDADSSLSGQISTLTSRVNNAEASISSEQTARANADSALTSNLNSLSSTVGSNYSALLSEQTTRTNKDNSLAQAINTIWAAMSGNNVLIQDGQLAGISPAAVTATRWTQLQAAVTDPNTGQISATAIKQDLSVYASKVDGTLNTTWSIKSDVSGYVSGVALMTTSGAGSSPGAATSHFMIMADRLSLVNPSNTTLKAAPFSVDGAGNGVFSGIIYAAGGVFGGSLSAATGTFAGSLSAASGTFSGRLTAAAIDAVDTINLKGSAVTVPIATQTAGQSSTPYGTYGLLSVTLGTITTSSVSQGRVTGWIGSLGENYTASIYGGYTGYNPWEFPGLFYLQNGSLSFRLKRNGTVILSKVYNHYANTGVYLLSSSCAFNVFHDVPGPGVTATYTLEAEYNFPHDYTTVWTLTVQPLAVVLMESRR